MGSLTMAAKLVLVLLLAVAISLAQEEKETSVRQNTRQRLRALFNKRRLEKNEEQTPQRIRIRPVNSQSEDEDEDEGFQSSVSVTSSISSSVSRQRLRPQVDKLREEENNEIEEEVEETKAEKVSPRQKPRLRFNLQRNREKDSTDKLLDKLLNNVDETGNDKAPRRRFRPSINRDQLRQKAGSAFSSDTSPVENSSKLRLRFRRPNRLRGRPTTTETSVPLETVPTTLLTTTETVLPEVVTESVQTTLAETQPAFITTLEQRRKTTLPQVVTEGITIEEVTTQKPERRQRPSKFDLRQILRPRLRTTTRRTTPEPEVITTIRPRTPAIQETTQQERLTTVQHTPTVRPFEIRVESLFDSFPNQNEPKDSFGSNIDALKHLQLIAQTSTIRKPVEKRPVQNIRPAFRKPVPEIILKDIELPINNEIVDPFPAKNLRPAFIGVKTTNTRHRQETVHEPREIVFEVEESVRSIEQPRRIVPEIRSQIPSRRQQEVIRIEEAPQQQSQAAFNQILPLPVKPQAQVFTPATFDFPAFFSEPFTFLAFQDQEGQKPGPGSYAYRVGLIKQ